MKVTSTQVKRFWKYMSRKYKFEVVNKKDAFEMQLVAWALEQMGILDEKTFMEHYSVTIPLGKLRRVYVPFEIGKGTQGQLKGQVLNCCHETQHVVQANEDYLFAIRYLGSDTRRALYEMEALRTDMEMAFFIAGHVLSPVVLSNKLKAYSIGKKDRRTVHTHLKACKKIVERGGVYSSVSKNAIRWWKKQ